jgi:glucose-6-phosphate dehydrogenase assembly protein OpcA
VAVPVTFSRGSPVEIAAIDRELKKLWEQTEASATRASLMNLAVYCEGEDALDVNTELISRFTANHACRSIVVAVDPAAADGVEAWISAHCHMNRAGEKQVCCEQLSFLLGGKSQGVFPNILFSHLDSDLPLYLWWQGEFHGPLDEQLRTWVDRLIFDSASWSEWKKPFAFLRDSLLASKARLTLCDLNWTRTLYLRQALAQLFDDPANLPYLDCVRGWKIGHAPGLRSTAVLFAGWLAAQLGWRFVEAGKQHIVFKTASGSPVEGKLEESDSAAIGHCCLSCDDADFRFEREPGSDFFHADFNLPDGCERHYLLPAGREEKIDLLDQELAQGGKHRVYLKALQAAEPLFEK